jgi:hypothetical protein
VKRPFKLVPLQSTVSHDTVKCLQAALEQALAGEIIGVAMAIMYRKREYHVQTCGELHKNPTFCRGAVAALGDQVAKQQWGGA